MNITEIASKNMKQKIHISWAFEIGQVNVSIFLNLVTELIALINDYFISVNEMYIL